MHADGVHVRLARHIQHAVEQAAALGAGDRDVEVAVFDDRVLGQQRIAVVAIGVHGIAPIGKVGPHAVGEELVLRGLRPTGVARGVAVMAAEHFLEKYDVGLGAAHRLAQFGQDIAAVEGGETLVGVDGQYLQSAHGRRRLGAGKASGVRFEFHGCSW
ncbi:hypothetical protein D3C79_723850 [compost metagenome]